MNDPIRDPEREEWLELRPILILFIAFALGSVFLRWWLLGRF